MSVAFGAGLWAGLDSFPRSGEWGGVALVLAAALLVAREAPVGAAIGVMGVAGLLWGAAAVREQDATCAGRWTAGGGAGDTAGEGGRVRAVVVRLADPAPADGGVGEAPGETGACGGGAGNFRAAAPPPRGGAAWVPGGGAGG